MKDLLEKLAELRIAEREIKEKIDAIYPEVVGLVENEQIEDGTIIEIPSGKFTVSYRRTWEYTDTVENLSNELKKAKKEEEQKGIATYTAKPSVIFKSVIENENMI